jgi:integrase
MIRMAQPPSSPRNLTPALAARQSGEKWRGQWLWQPCEHRPRKDVLAILRATVDVPTTMKRLRADMEAIITYADVPVGHNPATRSNLNGKMPKVETKTENHPALPREFVAPFFAALGKDKRMIARALQFIMLTHCRQNEALQAKWSEFDLTNRVWTVPAERMKTGIKWRVPLTDAMVKVLKATGTSEGYVFANPNTATGFFDSKVTRRLCEQYVAKVCPDEDGTPHGMRSCATSWYRPLIGAAARAALNVRDGEVNGERIILLVRVPLKYNLYSLRFKRTIDSMEHRGVHYTIRAGIEHHLWAVAIYFGGVERAKRFYGTRENAEFRARSIINRLLKEQMPNENKSTDEDRFARQDRRRYSGWASLVVIAIVVIVIGGLFYIQFGR